MHQWTFNLRKGLLFHDGTPCTAADVVASFEAILDPKTASPARAKYWPGRKVVTARIERTVVFKLVGALCRPAGDARLHKRPASCRPRSRAGEMTRLDREAIGTGPFKLVSYEPDRLIVVQRNDRYYDPARPYLDRVEVVVYPDPTAEGSALISGAPT